MLLLSSINPSPGLITTAWESHFDVAKFQTARDFITEYIQNCVAEEVLAAQGSKHCPKSCTKAGTKAQWTREVKAFIYLMRNKTEGPFTLPKEHPVTTLDVHVYLSRNSDREHILCNTQRNHWIMACMRVEQPQENLRGKRTTYSNPYWGNANLRLGCTPRCSCMRRVKEKMVTKRGFNFALRLHAVHYS